MWDLCLIAAVWAVGVVGTAPGTPQADTVRQHMIEPDEGWSAYCQDNNLWVPYSSQKDNEDICRDVGSVATCGGSCEWDLAEERCVPIRCHEQKTPGQCLAKEGGCIWRDSTQLCTDAPPALDCEAKTTAECLQAHHIGCYLAAGADPATDPKQCKACVDIGDAASCATTNGECKWTPSVQCHRDPKFESRCHRKTEARCTPDSGCYWDVVLGACEPHNCSAATGQTACKALTGCHYSLGMCDVGELNCNEHNVEAECTLLADCTYRAAAGCAAPKCHLHVSVSLCDTTAGCEWNLRTGVCVVSNPGACTSLVDAGVCTAAAATEGCVWVDAGCHAKADAVMSDCTGIDEAGCGAVDGCVWEAINSHSNSGVCDVASCEGLSEQHCMRLASGRCQWDEKGSECKERAHGGHDHDHHHSPPYNILVIFLIAAVGAFFRHNFSNSVIPYTVWLFVAGAAFAGLSQVPALVSLRKYVDLASIDPHLLFYIFLPVLIFESAFAVDWFVFQTVIWHCLLLAGPGILVASFLTALLPRYIFTSYGWSWEACGLFGVTLSATDPVAVVALLKELGASVQISTLIEGESLLNDGTAIVFFTVLHNAVAGCTGEYEGTAADLILQILKVAVGGPALGYVFGIVAVISLSRVFNDPLVEITTSLVTAYATFFVAEAYFHVSGVLAVVVCGIYMSHRRQCISPEVYHTLHEFWEMCVYLGNTLIFTMAGMIVVDRALMPYGREAPQLEWIDGLYLVITYIGIFIIRLLTIVLFSFIFNTFDYQLDVGNIVLVAWGGLRGAVGLALALIVAGDERLTMRDQNDPRTILQNKLVFFVSGVVIATLLINGTTTRFVVAEFNLDQVSETRKRMMKVNFKRLTEAGMDKLEDLKTESALYDVNWLEARRWVFDDMKDPYNHDEEFLGEGDQHAEAIMHYFKIMHSSVWEQNEEGLLDGDAVRFLLAKINEREKLAKKKDQDFVQMAPDFGNDDDYQALEDGNASPLVAGAGSVSAFGGGERIDIKLKYPETGRDFTVNIRSTDTVKKLKARIFTLENIPVHEQRLMVPDTGAVAADEVWINTLAPPVGDFELVLEKVNADEDILLNAQILEQFWEFEDGCYGVFERMKDKVYRCGRSISYKEFKWKYGFNVAMALVIAHDAVLAKIDNVADPAEANKLKKHAKRVKREVLQQLVAFAGHAPQTSIAIKTTLAARTVLNHARKKVWAWQKEGLIENKEASVLVGLVEGKMKELTRADRKMQPCNPDYILSEMEWYRNAIPEIKDQLKTNRRVKYFKRGELLIKKGEEHDSIVLITAGSARVHVTRRFDYVGPGYAAGLLSALTSTTKYCDVYAETDVQALVFPADAFVKMLHKKGNESFAAAVWTAVGTDLAYKLLRSREPYSKYTPRDVRRFVRKGRLMELQKYRPEDKKVALHHGSYHILISGRARDATGYGATPFEDLDIIEAPALLPVECVEAYLHNCEWEYSKTGASAGSSDDGKGFGFGGNSNRETREDEVHIIIVEDPSSASARARKYWEQIYKKIRSVKATATLRGMPVTDVLQEVFSGDLKARSSATSQVWDAPVERKQMNGTDEGSLKTPLLSA